MTVPLEDALQGVPGVTEVESESVPQLSAIFLYFKNGTDVLQARQLVQERLPAAAPTLPSWCGAARDVSDRVGDQPGDADRAHLEHGRSRWTSRGSPLFNDPAAAAWHVPGVANVAIWGERSKEIQVQADPARLMADKISLDELMDAASNAVDNGLLTFTSGSTIGSGGFIETPNQRLGVRDSR